MAFPSHHPPSAAHGSESDACRIGVLEKNRGVATRIARVLSCATGFSEVAVGQDLEALEVLLGPDPALIAASGDDIELLHEWASARYPAAKLIVWSGAGAAPLLDFAGRNPALTSILAWPSFESMPRAWELSLAARRIVDPQLPPPRLAELFGWGSTVVKYRPRSTVDRDAVVSEVEWISEKAGAPPRTAARLAEVAHELLMNAMYDAPADEDGHPRYSHDRKMDIELDDSEVPTFRLASDGVTLALQVVDNFGRLTRAHVVSGVTRGLGAAHDPSANVLDTSQGGAGLGIFRIFSASAATVVEIKPGRYSIVTSFFDLNVNARDARTMPVSLHLFDDES